MQPSIHRLQTRAVEAGTFPSMMGGWDDPERCGVETAVCGDQMVRARNGCHDNLPARAAQPTVVCKVAPAISRRGLGRAHRPQPPAASCPGPNTAAPDLADSGAACRVGAPPHPAYGDSAVWGRAKSRSCSSSSDGVCPRSARSNGYSGAIMCNRSERGATAVVSRIPGRGRRGPAICSRPTSWGRGICVDPHGTTRFYSIHTIAIVGRGTWASQVRYKTADALCEHFVRAWAWLGLPRVAQIDNEMAATGGGRHAFGLSLVVRLHLLLGVHLIFVPPGEPGRNPFVESFNGSWQKYVFAAHLSRFARGAAREPRALALLSRAETPSGVAPEPRWRPTTRRVVGAPSTRPARAAGGLHLGLLSRHARPTAVAHRAWAHLLDSEGRRGRAHHHQCAPLLCGQAAHGPVRRSDLVYASGTDRRLRASDGGA